MRHPRRYLGLKESRRLDRLMPPSQKNGKRKGFETVLAVTLEDARRAKALRRLLGDEHAAKLLAKELEQRDPPKTMASARWMREERLDFGAAVLEALEPWPRSKIRFFAAIPRSGEVPVRLLDEVDGRAMKERFRQQINRLNLEYRSGFLIAFLEAEFEPYSETLRFHWHGVATGSYVKALKHLQELPSFKQREQVKRPFQINKLTSDGDRAQAISYLLKNHWKQRRIGPVGKDGVIKRQRKSQRLDEPYHSDALLWLDRHSVSDITLFMGCRMRNSVLEVTQSNTADRT